MGTSNMTIRVGQGCQQCGRDSWVFKDGYNTCRCGQKLWVVRWRQKYRTSRTRAIATAIRFAYKQGADLPEGYQGWMTVTK